MSGFWPATDDATTVLQPSIASGPPTDFAENFDAARKDQLLNSNPLSMYNDLSAAYGYRVREIYEKTGKRVANPILEEPPSVLKDVLVPGGVEHFRRNRIDAFEAEADLLRQQHPDLTTHQQMVAGLNEASAGVENAFSDVSSRASFSGKIGQLAGSLEASVQDPVILLTLPFGAARNAGILRAAVTDAAVAGGTEALTQPQVQASRIERGQRGGVGQGAENVALATGGAFGAGVVLRSIAHLAGVKLLDKFDANVKNPTPTQEEARAMYGRIADVNGQSPLDSMTPGALEEHNARLAAAMKGLEAGQETGLSFRSAAPVSEKALAGGQALDNLDGILWKFQPDEIKTDAKTFQFKQGGDDAGVTDRLKGVSVWDPVKAGQVIVYDDGVGGQFIADGHQRLGLAQRLQEENPGARIQLYGTLFRAQDGYTPEMVRAIAAMKNIAEGTGSAVDAAKVLRVDPTRIRELPPRSALVRQAADMVNLSDNSFGMVVNEIVPADQAALVGRLVKDPQLQDAIMQVLAKTEPENPQQAESVIRQAMAAGTHTEIQQGLFGDEMITTSLFGERAKVLDKTLKKLRGDARVFASLVKNEDNIAAAGNILSRDVNEARAQTDARAVQLIQTLANRKGPLSDALTTAARRAANEGRYANATTDFAGAVRAAIERGDFDGLAAGGAGSLDEAQAQNAARAAAAAEQQPAEQSLSLFDVPAGQGSEQQTRALQADLARQVERLPPGPSEGGILDTPVPAALAVDGETGQIVAHTQTIGQILEEIDRDAAELEAIGLCGRP